MYQKRKEYLEGMLEAEAAKLTNQARFIVEKCSGELVVENKKRKTIVDELLRRGYAPDPVQEWKKAAQKEEEQADDVEEEEEEQEAAPKKKSPADSGSTSRFGLSVVYYHYIVSEKDFKNLSEVKKFDYLLGMSMWMLTEERKNELLKQKDKKLHELEVLKKLSNKDIWREDLDVFMEKLDAVEEQERKEEEMPIKQGKKGLMVRKNFYFRRNSYFAFI